MPDRVCCYITSPDKFYSKMVLNSISMLRAHNKTVKVRVFVVGKEGEEAELVDRYAEELNIEVVKKPWTKSAAEQKYFILNREYLGECPESSVLHIDGDTFVFGDVEKIFERYKDVDFAAAVDQYIVNSPDWSHENMEKTFEYFGAFPVHIFNGGVTLWNNGTVKGWTDGFLADACARCESGELPIYPWLINVGRDCYHKETFAVCLYVAKAGLKYGLLDSQDVINLFNEACSRAFDDRNTVIYHCFTHNWKQFYKRLTGTKLRVPKRVIGASEKHQPTRKQYVKLDVANRR